MVRLVDRCSVRARRRLTRCLGGTNFGIARTAMSESVESLGLAGLSMGNKHRGCVIRERRRSKVDRGCVHMLYSKFISVSVTRGVLIVGAITKVTVTITTTMSTVG